MNKHFIFAPVLLLTVCHLACREKPVPESGPVPEGSNGAGRKVEIRKTAAGFQLYRNGSPYFIKGAAGTEHLDVLREAGGNSLRTYTTDGLDTLLDQAQALGLTVMAGIWIGRAYEGFDYSDTAAVARQKEEVRAVIRRYKDHPALLCWAMGNEPNNGMEKSDNLWPALRALIDMAHAEDPDHPVTVPIYPFAAQELAEKCPNIDFISVNAFANIIAFVDDYRLDKPYLFTELGIEGPWEAVNTHWYAVVEGSVEKKQAKVRSHYQHALRDTARSLGSYVFYWGQKQEFTPTWFSFFAENGDKTPLVDLMYELWGGRPGNRAPLIEDFAVDSWRDPDSLVLTAGRSYSVAVRAGDPDGDRLQFRWEILPDGPFFKYVPGRGKTEIRPRQLEKWIIRDEGARIVFRAPAHFGPFRLFVHVSDGRGNTSSVNLPFFVTDNNLTDE